MIACRWSGRLSAASYGSSQMKWLRSSGRKFPHLRQPRTVRSMRSGWQHGYAHAQKISELLQDLPVGDLDFVVDQADRARRAAVSAERYSSLLPNWSPRHVVSPARCGNEACRCAGRGLAFCDVARGFHHSLYEHNQCSAHARVHASGEDAQQHACAPDSHIVRRTVSRPHRLAGCATCWPTRSD